MLISSFIHTVHSYKRNQKEAEFFFRKEKSDGYAPLFLSAASFYEQVLYNTYCHIYQDQPCGGRSRTPLQKEIVDENLKYAQLYTI